MDFKNIFERNIESEDIFIKIKNEDFDFDATFTFVSYRKTMLLRYGNLN